MQVSLIKDENVGLDFKELLWFRLIFCQKSLQLHERPNQYACINIYEDKLICSYGIINLYA